MKRIRQKVRERTGSNRGGVKDIRVVIRDLNPVLRGWGNHFRTGNAAEKFNQLDSYVQRRLRRMLAQRYGRNLRPHHWQAWTSDWFRDQGLHRMRGDRALSGGCVAMSRGPSVSRVREGAADKAATQLVRVQPCRLSVFGHEATPHPGAGNRPGHAWCERPGGLAWMEHVAVGATWRPSKRRSPKVID